MLVTFTVPVKKSVTTRVNTTTVESSAARTTPGATASKASDTTPTKRPSARQYSEPKTLAADGIKNANSAKIVVVNREIISMVTKSSVLATINARPPKAPTRTSAM